MRKSPRNRSMKTFVLDTNVLLQSPGAIFAFNDNHVVIPEAVVEELDNFKKDKSEKGVNARETIRTLDALRMKGKVTEGVKLDNGGDLRVEINHEGSFLPASWDPNKPDNRIIQACVALRKQDELVFLVTRDAILRIKAEVVGIEAQDFRNDQAPLLEEQYTGRRILRVSEILIAKLSEQGFLEIPEEALDGLPLVENQFITLVCDWNEKKSRLGVFRGGRMELLRFEKSTPYGIKPRNAGQRFFIEALLRPVEEAPLVIVKGPAGTAKTFLSLAAGLERTFNNAKKAEREFRRILVCRPNVTMDEEIGFLPGTETEKIAPLMRPILDNLEALVDSDPVERYGNEKELANKIKALFDQEIILTQAVSFLRGRSIAKHWVIIDEAQNLTANQVKAIITRAGEGTKIILAGDPAQIDHAYLDSRTNGLSNASEAMKGSPLCWQVTFKDEESVRSPLAANAATRL